MPYGVADAVWSHLPADDQTAIKAAYQGQPPPAIGGYAPPPDPVPSPPPAAAPPTTTTPEQIAAADAAGAYAAAGAAALLAGGSAADIAAAEAAAGAPPDVVAAILATGIPAAAGPTATQVDAEGNPLDTSYDDDPDAEAGPEPSAEDYQLYSAEADAIEQGQPVLLSADHPVPGTVIGTPYTDTHAVAFNRAGGSDNWQSENADDVWLYPGTAITAVADGTISPGGYGYGLSGSGGRFAGWRLHLITPNGKAFFYTHMSQLLVPKGAKVVAGQLIGRSGIANGVPHLHFAARPPFAPGAFVKAAYSLKDRAPIADPVIGGAGVQGGTPDFDLNDSGVQAAWLDLMRVFGLTYTAAAAHIKDARAALDAAVS